MAQRLVVSDRAQREIGEAYEWYEERLPGLGTQFLKLANAQQTVHRPREGGDPATVRRTTLDSRLRGNDECVQYLFRIEGRDHVDSRGRAYVAKPSPLAPAIER